MHTPRLACFAVGLVAVILLGASGASAISFQADFVSSTYDTQPSDTFSSLLAQHQAGSLIQSNTLDGFEDVANTLHAGNVTADYSMLLTTTITFVQAGHYSFQVGTDWGRGGAAAVLDATNSIVSEQVYDRDLWWAYDWNDPDVFTTELDVLVGETYTLQWVGFEGCCGGSTTVRFSIDGGAYVPVTTSNMDPFSVVPEPGTGAMVALGVVSLGVARRGRSRR